MIKKITFIGLFDDDIGKRITISYTELDKTGKIISDNKRLDRVLLNDEIIYYEQKLREYAQKLIQEGD